MRVKDLKNQEGRIFAFEVSNKLLGRRALLQILGSIPQVEIIRKHSLLTSFQEE